MIRKPKAETRRPKEGRIPKSEIAWEVSWRLSGDSIGQLHSFLLLLETAQFGFRDEAFGHGRVADHFAVAHDDHPLGVLGNVQLMSDHDDGHALVIELLEHAHDV